MRYFITSTVLRSFIITDFISTPDTPFVSILCEILQDLRVQRRQIHKYTIIHAGV